MDQMEQEITRALVREEVLRTLARARQLAAEAPTPVGPTLLDYVISEADLRINQVQKSGLSATPLADYRDFLLNLKAFLEPE